MFEILMSLAMFGIIGFCLFIYLKGREEAKQEGYISDDYIENNDESESKTMKIINFEEKMKEAFYRWAENYLQSTAGRDLSEYPIEHILCTLIKKNILTIEQIRTELKMRKIQIHETYFEKALWLVENVDKGEDQ